MEVEVPQVRGWNTLAENYPEDDEDGFSHPYVRGDAHQSCRGLQLQSRLCEKQIGGPVTRLGDTVSEDGHGEVVIKMTSSHKQSLAQQG